MNIPVISNLINMSKRNCIIRIHRAYNGSDTEELQTFGQMKDDPETGSVRLVSEKYGLNEPALPYKYFKKVVGQKGVNRVVYFYCPYPNYFIPIEHSFLEVSDLNLRPERKENSCLYCQWEKERKDDTFKKTFQEFIRLKKVDEIPCCHKHMSKYIKAKFRVVPEERKEWYQQQIVKRIARRTPDKTTFLQSDAFKLMIFGFLMFLGMVVTYKFGWDGMNEMLETTFKKGAEMLKDAMIEGAKSYRP